ncbi:MAG: putative quinol monooxygenase [bacterium]
MIMAEFRIMVSDKERKSALDGLRSFMGPTGVKPGCIRCSISCDADNPNLITFTEKWQSQECLRQHIQSHQYRQLLSIIELSVREPEIGFYQITQIGGLEVIEEARTQIK